MTHVLSANYLQMGLVILVLHTLMSGLMISLHFPEILSAICFTIANASCYEFVLYLNFKMFSSI